ncbi:hypothetical protein LguiB_031917 [Lonicera macranthoides]
MAGGGGIGPSNGKSYPGDLTWKVIITCIVAAMGGLIFGYDLGISGGVTSMAPFLKKFFPDVYRKEELNVDSTNQYCKFNSGKLTFFTSSLYLAALASSLVASLSVPLYLSEMAPYKYRGALNIVFQLSITIGILAANLLNYFFAKIEGGWGWRLSLGGAVVPALIFIVGSLTLPDTPNSLIERAGRQVSLQLRDDLLEEAKDRLKDIRGVPNVDEEFNDLVAASDESRKIERPWLNLLMRKYRPQLTFAVLIPLFQQLTGMNVITFYAPVLFKTIGFGANASLMSALITGGVNCGATFVAIVVVDRFGRRALFIEGGAQMLICQVVISVAIALKFGTTGKPGQLSMGYAEVVVTFICIYVAAFAWSWGPLGWLVPSEIFPLEVRSAAQSVNVSVNMTFTFIIAQIFLQMLCSFKFGLFIFFAFFVVIMSLFIFFFLPETKGIHIEDMATVWRDHWFWKRFFDPPQGGQIE